MSVGSLNILVWNVADLPVWVNPLYGGLDSKPAEVQSLARQHLCHAICVQEAEQRAGQLRAATPRARYAAVLVVPIHLRRR